MPRQVVVYDEPEGTVLRVGVPARPRVTAAQGMAKGDKGDPGTSVYELAVAQGFVGTEAEWLAARDQYVADAVTAHRDDLTPHPAYDDMPSLVLIYENGLV